MPKTARKSPSVPRPSPGLPYAREIMTLGILDAGALAAELARARACNASWQHRIH